MGLSPDDKLKPYWARSYEPSCESVSILWCVPPQGREVVLAELHSGHLGISRMKSLMRGLVWWQGIDTEVEAVVKKCHLCQQVKPASSPAPLHPWQWPTHPWSRLHLDYAGPVAGKMLLLVIDA